MSDPLAGQRQRINENRSLAHLIFPDTGTGCPVAVGDVFPLRTCTIEVLRIGRVGSGRRIQWRADFARFYPESGVTLLARGAGDGHGYTSDPDLALAAQDDPDAMTIASTEPLDHPSNLRPPPEPEAVPRHEVETLPSSVKAHADYERQRRADAERRSRMAPADHAAALREQTAQGGPGAQLATERRQLRARRKRSAGPGR